MYESGLLESGKVLRGSRISVIGAKVVDDTEDFTIPVYAPPPPPEGYMHYKSHIWNKFFWILKLRNDHLALSHVSTSYLQLLYLIS